MEDGLAAYGILLIVEGDDNLGGLAEMLGGSVPREEEVPNKEHKVHVGPELDRPEVAGALRVFVVTETELEANDDQVGDVGESGVRGNSCNSDDGVHDSQGGGLFLSEGGIFKPVDLDLPREALVDTGVCLGVGRFSRVGTTI